MCIMYQVQYDTVSDRQHVEVAQATIFSLSESDDIVRTSGNIFQEMRVFPGPLLVNTTVYFACYFDRQNITFSCRKFVAIEFILWF